ncbi:MAG: nucleobase:cation symporter-2 family protein [Desulforhopalus sp.]
MANEGSESLKDPDYIPPFHQAIPLGIQHVLAMFASNVTPAIIVSLAAGFTFGSAEMIYMIQIVMVFAGISTLLQTVGLGRIGARLPIVQGTSFAFIPIMIPIVKTAGMAALFGGVVLGGIFHFFLGTVVGRLRNLLPPLVTGIVVLTIGLSLIPVGIKYAAGGVPLMGKPGFGSLEHWTLALIVITVTLALKFFTKGIISTAGVLIALVVGYLVAIPMDMVSFAKVSSAPWFSMPSPLQFGFEINLAAIVGMCLMSFVSAIETVGDISGITKGGAGREATDREISGGTLADGLGTALAGLFGGLPNTSFSQNVGLISMTGVMSRHVVSFGAIFLVIAGLIPKVGAVISAMPISVLGGGVIVMFGMVVSAGVTMLSEVSWDRRNMLILAISLSIGLGLQAVPEALQHVPGTLKILSTSGILPAALLAITFNMILPKSLEA